MGEITRASVRPLLEVQRIDSTVDRLRARLADLPEQHALDELIEHRRTLGGTHAERATALDALAREQGKRENDIALIDQKDKSERARMDGGTVQSPKELLSIQAELEALGRRKEHFEDQLLEIMEQREELETEVGGLTAGLADLDARIADATAARDTATVEIEKELADLDAQRQSLLPSLDDDVIELYEGVRAKKGGVGVGALEDGTCRACSLPLSPAARDEIRRSDEPLPRCENCRRLLVVL